MTVEKRPWGTYEVLDEGKNYRVKKITIYPEQRFSKQLHRYRKEYWTFVSGYGEATINKTVTLIRPGTSMIVEKEDIHRVSNRCEDINLVIIETQIGKCDEDDIIRIEDDYERV